MLHGVLADAPGEKLDRHGAEHRMAALPGPVAIGKGGEQARRLLVLAGDRVEKRSRRLAAREAGAPVALRVEVGDRDAARPWAPSP
jgi:hypothetical protein